ncbi:hypothetical protein [Photobacterium kagoshimensis]|uniref:hypothetical protein n=1 Tax=Photobacterium kagoshimensis TaxID=2910242 RepID=UPI003D12CE79
MRKLCGDPPAPAIKRQQRITIISNDHRKHHSQFRPRMPSVGGRFDGLVKQLYTP